MYLAEVTKLDPGVKLAKDIYTADDKILLKKDIKLTKNYIEKLKELNINYIYVKDKNLKDDIEVEEIVSDKIKREAVVIAKECLKNVNLNKESRRLIQPEKIINLVEEILEDIRNNRDIIINLRDIRKLEDELFFHLVNVTIFSLILGESLNYTQEELKLLGIGAFLHDIGKALVPAEILNKPAKLSDAEFEVVKKHTVYGYSLLTKHTDIDELSARIAYQHHERCDGSGYPLGIEQDEIHEFGRVVAIADVFDAMRSDRVYRPACSIREVIEYLYTMITKQQLDDRLMEEFLNYLTPYPVGTKVKLNNGYEGVVIKARKHANSRPVIKVLKHDDEELPEPITIDLNEKVDLIIEEEIV